MTTPILSRFRHINPETDIMYIGVAEITISKFNEQYEGSAAPGIEANILDMWECGTTLEKIEVMDNAAILAAIEETAIEQYIDPPAVKIEIPTDWDELEIVEVETVYTIHYKVALPNVTTDTQAMIYGLSNVKRIRAIPGKIDNGAPLYKVRAAGDIADVKRELWNCRLF